MRHERKQKAKPMHRRLAVLLICALIPGILSAGNPTVGKAASSVSVKRESASAQGGSKGSVQLHNPTVDADGVTTWDTIYFGSYWQNDTNGDGTADQNDAKEPIKWRVLSVDGDDAFLLADRNLDCRQYNTTFTDVTWETCTMRSWLNGYGASENKEGKDYSGSGFIDAAFTPAEQSAIKTTNVVNTTTSATSAPIVTPRNQSAIRTTNAVNNPGYGSEGVKDTLDKVYLLSCFELMSLAYGFSSNYLNADESRRAKNTEYAKAQGASTHATADGQWWLRREDSLNCAPSVSAGGWVNYYIYYGVDSYDAVRPALHINLSPATGWSYGGKVRSDGSVSGSEATPAATTNPSAKPVVSPGAEPTKKPGSIPGSPNMLSNPTTDADGVTTWDTIYFGNYWQSDTNGDGTADRNDAKEPIKWRVLSVDGDDAFLLADRNLDCRAYNDTWATDVIWETCTMRSWLNGYEASENKDGKDYSGSGFINTAFTPAEQSAIKTANVVNKYGTESDNASDKVFLLSYGEVINSAYGFSPDDDTNNKVRRAKNTEYAKEQGAYTHMSGGNAGNGLWWLRNGGVLGIARNVYFNGDVMSCAFDASYSYGAVRPALHLNLSSATGWLYGGKVRSDGSVSGSEATPVPKPTTPATSPATTTSPSANPVVSPGVEPTEKPGSIPGPTVEPEVTPTPKPTTAPSESQTPDPGNPTVRPNDNTQAPPSGSVPNRSGGTQSPEPPKADSGEKTEQDGQLSQPKAGTVLTVSGKKYKVQGASGKKKTVVILKAGSKKLKKAVIPNTVKYKSKTYQVTEISKNAFKGCRELTEVTIGSKVKVIGSGAFSGCKKLKTVTVRSKILKKVGKGAFAGISPKAKLKAPKSKLSRYRKLMEKAGWHE